MIGANELGVVVVTGSTGFIGRRLVAQLEAAGACVVPWSRTVVNLLDTKEVASIFTNVRPDTVFHLAATGVAAGSAHDARLVSSDLQMVKNLIEAAPTGMRLLLAGSMSEYGRAGRLSEDDRCSPRTAYGIAKLAAGLYAMAYAPGRGLHLQIARLFGVYGPGEAPTRFFPKLLSSLRIGEPMRMSDGMQRRDFIHVDDACAAMIALARAPVGMPPIVNIGTGEAVSVREVAEWIVDAAGVSRDLLLFGATKRSPGDEDLLVAAVDRLADAIGWIPPQRLRPGMRLPILTD